MNSRFPTSFSNIPLINLREEFKATQALVESNQAEAWFAPGWCLEPIRAPMFVWCGMPEDLVGLLLQRAILGVEAYLPGALFHVSAVRGVGSQDLYAKLNVPSAMGSKSYVANLYHRLPTLVDPDLSLRHIDHALYQRTVVFYRNVRNPLFHGKQFCEPTIEELRTAFSHIGALYQWIDGWNDPKKAFRSSIELGPLTLTVPITFTEDAP